MHLCVRATCPEIRPSCYRSSTRAAPTARPRAAPRASPPSPPRAAPPAPPAAAAPPGSARLAAPGTAAAARVGGQLAPIPPRAWSSALPAPEEASGAAGAAGLRRGRSAGAWLRVRAAGRAGGRLGPRESVRRQRGASLAQHGGTRPRSCGCRRRLRGYSLRLRTRKAEAAARALGACPGSLAARRLRPPFPARYVPIPRGSLRSRTFYFGDAPGRCVRIFPSAARSLERFCLRGCALRLCFCR